MSLWNTSKIRKKYNSPQSRASNQKSRSKETSFCTCQKASLTLEATIVIPLVAGFFVTILFFFRVLQVQASVEEALLYAGRKTAVESSVVEEEIALFASAKAYLMVALEDEPVVKKYVKQGSFGVALLGSQLEGNEITLRAHYTVKMPISMFGMEGISLWNRATFRKWVGDRPESEEGQWVYIAQTGTVYHATDSCRAIKIKILRAFARDVTYLRGANGQKYYECHRCAKGSSGSQIVYYTNYGSLYHGKLDCSAIKRTVSKIELSEVGERRPCSFCY